MYRLFLNRLRDRLYYKILTELLKYKGADETSMILERGMPLYEMEKQKTVSEIKDGNMVIRGECVSACANLKGKGIQVDLVYIDLPFASDRVQNEIFEFNNKNVLNSKKKFTPIAISKDGLELIEFLSVDCTSKDGEWHSDSELKIDKNGYVTVNGKKTKKFWDGKIRCENKPLRLKIRNICGDKSSWLL